MGRVTDTGGLLGPRPGGRAPFVDRERELAVLTAALQAALAGQGSLCLVYGEPGIAKTRLLEELASAADAGAALAVWGRGWDADDAPPFWPWVQILRTLLATEEGSSAAAADSPAAQQVARLASGPFPNE